MKTRSSSLSLSAALCCVASMSGFAATETICSLPSDSGTIDDNGSYSIEITPSLTGNITDLNVTVNILHEWIGDLKAQLKHNGTEITLLNQLPDTDPTEPLFGTCNNNNIIAVLDDEAAESIQNQCPPVADQVYSPMESLSTFDSSDISGTWTITVSDLESDQIGSFLGWCLIAEIGVEPEPEPEPSPNPISGDFNGDNVVNIFDLSIYRSWFISNDTRADLNGDGKINPFDIALFRQFWQDEDHPEKK